MPMDHLWKNQNFIYIWIAQVISAFGNSLYFISLMWLIWDSTKSTALSGMFAIIYDIPQLALGLWIGILISRYSLKQTLMFTDLVRAIVAFIVFLLYMANGTNLVVLFTAIFVEGTLLAINRPASMSILPLIVSEKHLISANSYTQMSTRTANILGYGVSGLLISLLGVSVCLVYTSVSYFINTFMISKLSGYFITAQKTDSLKEDLKSGYSYLWKEKSLLIVFSIGILMNVGGSPIGVLGPAFSEKILNDSATGYGMMQGTWVVGIAIGAFMIRKLAGEHLWITLAVGFFVQGIAQFGFSYSTTLWVAAGCLFVHGTFMSVANIPLSTYIQRKVPSHFLAHVFSILGTLVMAVNPLAYAASGFLADWIGLRETYRVGSLFPILAALLVVFTPWLKRMNSNQARGVLG